MGQWISVFLQACGVLLLLWAGLGFLFCRRWAGAALVIACFPGHDAQYTRAVSAYLWLRGIGLFRGSMILSDCGLNPEEKQLLAQMTDRCPDIQICPEDTLNERLRLEAVRHGRTGAAAG